MNPDRRTLQALAALEHDANFKIVLAWVKSCRDEARADDKLLSETHVRWNQGRAQAGTDLIEAAETARKALQNMK